MPVGEADQSEAAPSQADKGETAEREVRLAEYNALRAEILILIQYRNQFLLFDLGGFGFAFAWAVAAPHPHKIFFLVAPLIHYPMALYWEYVDRQIIRIGHHIKSNIELRLGYMSWEQKESARRSKFWEQTSPSEQTSPPWFKQFFPKWSLSGHTPTELSGLMTFLGTTLLSLFSWFFVAETATGGSATALPLTPKEIVFILFLLALDVFVFPFTYRLIQKGRKSVLRELSSLSELPSLTGLNKNEKSAD